MSFAQDADGVTARLRTASGEGDDGDGEECRARSLIGCDGAHSTVRKGLRSRRARGTRAVAAAWRTGWRAAAPRTAPACPSRSPPTRCHRLHRPPGRVPRRPLPPHRDRSSTVGLPHGPVRAGMR
uniref:FAD-dependent monooxygenase n=1 Tax=Streptomyces hiroshimensis TaxID=66424 RepID=UPI0035709E66